MGHIGRQPKNSDANIVDSHISKWEVYNQALSLYNDLKAKDLRVINSEAGQQDEDFEENEKSRIRSNLDAIDRELLNMTEESIRNIKMMVLVVLIYEITLNYDDALKPKLQ